MKKKERTAQEVFETAPEIVERILKNDSRERGEYSPMPLMSVERGELWRDGEKLYVVPAAETSGARHGKLHRKFQPTAAELAQYEAWRAELREYYAKAEEEKAALNWESVLKVAAHISAEAGWHSATAIERLTEFLGITRRNAERAVETIFALTAVRRDPIIEAAVLRLEEATLQMESTKSAFHSKAIMRAREEAEAARAALKSLLLR